MDNGTVFLSFQGKEVNFAIVPFSICVYNLQRLADSLTFVCLNQDISQWECTGRRAEDESRAFCQHAGQSGPTSDLIHISRWATSCSFLTLDAAQWVSTHGVGH